MRTLPLLSIACLLAAPANAASSNIMLVGYWPPTNEMLRQFSTNPAQNPGGWKGQNWEGRGYNVVSYFPEFPGGVGVNPKGNGDFEVDYQDTSADFWRITAEVKPVAIITFSRGRNGSNWEIEAGARNRAVWIDDYQAPFQPTPGKPDADYPTNAIRLSTLPMSTIEAQVDAANLGISAFIDNTYLVGSFLSEYLAYHGMWYQSMHSNPLDPDYVAMAGHVHVGINTNTAAATIAAEITLRASINAIPAPGALTFAIAPLLAGRRRRARA